MALFQQADNFGIAAAIVTLLALVAVFLTRRRIDAHEDRDGAKVGGILLGASLITILAVILAALFGPHPS